jgi:hypothetical protein
MAKQIVSESDQEIICGGLMNSSLAIFGYGTGIDYAAVVTQYLGSVLSPVFAAPSPASTPAFNQPSSAMTATEAGYFSAMLYGAQIETFSTHDILVGANQDSGVPNADWLNDFANSFYQANWHQPDQMVMSNLRAAGVAFQVTTTGAIYVAGMGYAVASSSSTHSGSSTVNASVGVGTVTNPGDIIVLGNSHTANLDAMLHSTDIVVVGAPNSNCAPLAGKAIAEVLKALAGAIVGSVIEDWWKGDAAEIKARADATAAQRAINEGTLNVLYSPTGAQKPITIMGRDSVPWSGVVQNHIFFTDLDNNGKFDTAIAQQPSGQWVMNIGTGWRNIAQPFLNANPGF